MFGNDSAPTRVYKYGAKRPHEGLDAYRREERAMHRLRNAEAEDAEPTPAPVSTATAAPSVPAPADPEVARERERLAAEKRVQGS